MCSILINILCTLQLRPGKTERVRSIKSNIESLTEQEEALQWLADTILARYSEQYNGAMGRERAQVLQGLRDRGVVPYKQQAYKVVEGMRVEVDARLLFRVTSSRKGKMTTPQLMKELGLWVEEGL